MKKFAGILLGTIVVFAGCLQKGPTVARIGKDTVDVKMIEERLQEAPPTYQNYLATEAGKKQFLDLLIRERLVLEAARQTGIDQRNEYRKAIADFRKEQARRTRDYEDNLLMELFVRDLHEKQIGVSDQEADQYYNEHKRDFTRPVAITARHILLSNPEEAKKILARVRAGEDFAKLARAVSTDPISASRGGEIGPFRRGELVPEFEDAVFKLKVGQVSDVVKTQFGYHIVKKTAEKSLPARPVEESKAEIRKILEKTKFDRWIEDAKKKYGVKVNYDALAKVKINAPYPGDAVEPGTQGNGVSPSATPAN